MTSRTLYFTAPATVEVREEAVPEPEAHQVRVRATYSAISPGSEALVYRGQWALNGDAPTSGVDPISDGLRYPFRYGYSLVGVVDAVGTDVDPRWQGVRVFALAPHGSHHCCTPDELVVLPDDLDDRDAVFLANAETAVNLVLDAAPRIGERVLVLGQGVVGLLATGCLARFPLDQLVTTELDPWRRQYSTEMGAHAALDPSDPEAEARLRELLHVDPGVSSGAGGADVILELTGRPEALNEALAYAGYETRIVVGSWYGAQSVPLDLGGAFHRQRIQLVASQVSTLASALRGRWTHARRMDVALGALRAIRPSRLVTDVFPLVRAPEAYATLASERQSSIQILFRYPEDSEPRA